MDVSGVQQRGTGGIQLESAYAYYLLRVRHLLVCFKSAPLPNPKILESLPSPQTYIYSSDWASCHLILRPGISASKPRLNPFSDQLFKDKMGIWSPRSSRFVKNVFNLSGLGVWMYSPRKMRIFKFGRAGSPKVSDVHVNNTSSV